MASLPISQEWCGSCQPPMILRRWGRNSISIEEVAHRVGNQIEEERGCCGDFQRKWKNYITTHTTLGLHLLGGHLEINDAFKSMPLNLHVTMITWTIGRPSDICPMGKEKEKLEGWWTRRVRRPSSALPVRSFVRHPPPTHQWIRRFLSLMGDCWRTTNLPGKPDTE